MKNILLVVIWSFENCTYMHSFTLEFSEKSGHFILFSCILHHLGTWDHFSLTSHVLVIGLYHHIGLVGGL